MTKENMREKKQGRSADPLMVLSVEKAFRVLSIFSGEKRALSLSQIAAEAGMDVSAAQRFTHTLMTLGYLHKDPASKRFLLTSRTLDLGYAYLRGHPLVATALPYLMHLNRETGETVNLTFYENRQIVFISRFLSHHVLGTDVVIGARLPAYCTAPGIAMLASMDEDEAVAELNASDLKPYTPQTTWQMDRLKEKLRRTQEKGYAVAFEEYYLGDLSVAAAIHTPADGPRAAINLAAPSSRVSPKEMTDYYAPLVMNAARAVTRS